MTLYRTLGSALGTTAVTEQLAVSKELLGLGAGGWHSKGCSSLPPGWPFLPFLPGVPTACTLQEHWLNVLATQASKVRRLEFFGHGVTMWSSFPRGSPAAQLSCGHCWGCQPVPCSWECLSSQGDAGDGATGTHRELDTTPAGFAFCILGALPWVLLLQPHLDVARSCQHTQCPSLCCFIPFNRNSASHFQRI